MSRVADHVAIEPRNVRAVNLEADLGNLEVLRGFSAGAHVIETTRQIVAGLQPGARSRAWSITGPYGAGKSTYAVFLTALLGTDADPAHAAAHKLLRAADKQLAELLTHERRRLGLDRERIVPCVAVARREPTALALSRALLSGASRATASRRGRKRSYFHELADSVENRIADPEVVFRATDEISQLGPVVIVVDELGKTLEFAADGSGEADLYLLQQLAERFSASDAFGGAIITVQHLAFEDYLVGTGDARRREWRKVHGRFDDIPFIADRSHGLTLLADALTTQATDSDTAAHIEEQCAAAEDAHRAVAGHVAPPSAATGYGSATYPLHPSAALALPTLAANLGQHDRSLVAFLASDSPASLRALTERMELAPGRDVPFVRLADLYDFFFSNGAAAAVATGDGLRFREIQARVDDAAGLDPLALEVLKTVAILNITAARDSASATKAIISDALVGPAAGERQRREVASAITTLEEQGLLTYREFAGEFRIWQGSDFDISAATAAAREQLGLDDVQQLTVKTIGEARPLRPIVAQRYSQIHQVLRFFEARFASPATDFGNVESGIDGADGLVLYVLGDDKPPTRVPAKCADGRPLVVVWSEAGRQLNELALDLAAARAVLEHAPELLLDAVARREMRFRVAAVRDHLVEAVDAGFDPDEGRCACFVRGRRRKTMLRSAGLSAELSLLCEERFPNTPVIRNEMINRRDLTSQGAKARRELLERIAAQGAEPDLGIEGYGPERAMYKAVLRHTGLHQEQRPGHWGFGAPNANTPLAEVWDAMMRFFDEAATTRRGIDELYGLLKDPPYGLKDGPIPVLLSVALQHRVDDVFLYQDGTFQTTVDAAMIERLLKAPERFTVKRAALLGIRAAVFDRLRELVEEAPAVAEHSRNATTLAVVRPLIHFASNLSGYAQATDMVSERARNVRRALLEATEPDHLLFHELPGACGLPAILESLSDTQQGDEFVARLRTALVELGGAYERLLGRICGLMREAFRVPEPGPQALREALRVRGGQLIGNVIDPKLRGFLLMAADRGLDDSEWLEALSMSISVRPTNSWSDHDVVAFEALLAERAGWFRRLEDLYFDRSRRGDDAFDARRVTITTPTGEEHSEVVSIDRVTQQVAGTVATNALHELIGKDLDPQRARAALIGALLIQESEARPADSLSPASASTSAISRKRSA